MTRQSLSTLLSCATWMSVWSGLIGFLFFSRFQSVYGLKRMYSELALLILKWLTTICGSNTTALAAALTLFSLPFGKRALFSVVICLWNMDAKQLWFFFLLTDICMVIRRPLPVLLRISPFSVPWKIAKTHTKTIVFSGSLVKDIADLTMGAQLKITN